MPLTEFQQEIAAAVSVNRTPDSHLAGGAALHFAPNSKRYSNDLDYFHDSVERVADAFEQDRKLLEARGYKVDITMNQPGFVRAIVSGSSESTKIEWAHDSAWRFMPVEFIEGAGYRLNMIDISINKVLALAGRDEARDFLDILTIHDEILPLGALCWAAVGKDPGFTPLSLLELLRRRGKYRPEDFERLKLVEPIDLKELKGKWLQALEEAENFISICPPEEIGCLYYSIKDEKFIAPDRGIMKNRKKIVPHFGRPGGVLPKLDTKIEHLG